jgi:DNA-binding NtrC family response regulator
MTTKPREPYSVLVTWLPVNARAAPLLQALEGNHLKPRVEHLYLCHRDTTGTDGDKERASLKATRDELYRRLDPICPEINLRPWISDAAPTDHNQIRPFAEAVLREVREAHPDARVIIHLSPGTPAMHAIWLLLGTTGLIRDPVELIQTSKERHGVERVDFSLDTWLRRYQKAAPHRTADDDPGQLWDPAQIQSPALRRVFEAIDEWAPLRVPILLLGERGTGKTTFANLIRARSPFQKQQKGGWPAVVCGNFRVNTELARSELFGHTKGAFTGATADRIGLLERADGDSLFLDEIADIDHDTQRLLIAAVEGRGFTRLGDTKLLHPRFRLIAATNRPEQELRGGLLDLDFLDRIAVFTLNLPALRECREDLPQAWRATLRRAAAFVGLRDARWQPFAGHDTLLRHLGAHPLPGNFRDLQRAAYHLLAALHAGKSEADALRTATEALGSAAPAAPKATLPEPTDLTLALPIDLDAHLEGYQRRWIHAAMTKAEGNATRAAELLHLKRKTFEDRRKKLLGE